MSARLGHPAAGFRVRLARSAAPQRPSVSLPESALDLDYLWTVYRDGRYRSLWRMVAAWGEPETWTDPDRCELGVRLLTQVGAERRGGKLLHRKSRAHPRHLGLADIRCREILGVRGPVAAWTFWEALPIEGSARARAHWLAMGAEVLLSARDLAGAADLLSRAEAQDSAEPWLRIVAARIALADEDQDEAETCYRALRSDLPAYRPAIQGLADLLQRADRAEEAEDLLADAAPRLESAQVWAQLAVVAALRNRFDVCARALTAWEVECLLPDRDDRRWAAGLRADIAAHAGDFAVYRSLVADFPEGHFHRRALAHVEANPGATARVDLAVPYIAQSHLTCVPATLVSLARFWQVPADHDEVADAICYDGTPDWRERRWAETAGFHTREFRVTWDAAVALLDRGIPFTLTTTAAESGHLQAVVGYEAARRLFSIRDPGSPYVRAALADALLEDQEPHGPRGMALIPRGRRQVLDEVELADAEDYDDLHQVSLALNRHDRGAATAAQDRLAARAPEGRLTLIVRRAVAAYDSDQVAMRGIDERLSARYPKDWRWRMHALGWTFNHLPRHEVVERHREAVGDETAPIGVLIRTIDLLRVDPDMAERVDVLMRRLRALAGHHPATVGMAADLDWEAGRREAAARWYRFAAFLDPVHEDRARSVFIAERCLGRSEGALAFLKDRADRARIRSAAPTLTVLWALDALGRAHEAAPVIAAQDAVRGDDGVWLLGCARWCLGVGDRRTADACIARAQGLAHRSELLRVQALRCDHDADPAGALAALREIANADPLDLGAVGHLLSLLRTHEGEAAAVAEITARQARHPHHYRLSVLRIQTLRGAEDPAADRALKDHLAAFPRDAWALREAGYACLGRGDADGALAWADRAQACEDEVIVHRLRAAALQRLGRTEEARASYRRALDHEPDDQMALDGLIWSCAEPGERLAELTWFRDLIRRRVILGDALLSYGIHAGRILGRAGAVAALREAHAARPDLWESWSSLAHALQEAGHFAEAVTVAEEGCARFPRLPRMWVDLALARRFAGDDAGEIAALGEALVLNPSYDVASRQLSEAHERRGDLAAAREPIVAALRHQPRDARLQGFLADLCLKAGQRGEATDLFARAVASDEDYEWAWGRLADLDEARALREARAVAERRSHSAGAMLRVANLLAAHRRAERREALDQACARDPRHVPSRRARMRLWNEVGEIPRIRQELEDPVWQGRPPAALRCEAAELAAERGEVGVAEREAEDLVKAFADDPEGLFLLGRIRFALGRFAEAATTFRDLVAVAPAMAVAHGWLGDALQRSERAAEAKAAFQRGLALDPTYAFAAQELVSLGLSDGDLTLAESALRTLELHQPTGFTRLLRLRVELKRDASEAADALRAVLCDEEANDSVAGMALREYATARGADAQRAVLERVVADSRAHLQAWYAYAPHWIAQTKGARLCDDLGAIADPAFERAAAAILEALAEAGRGAEVDRIIRTHRERLRAGAMAWGSAGYALTRKAAWQEARDWLADWRQREGVRAWMLANLSFCLRVLGDWAQAAAVVRGGLNLAPDHTEDELRCWACIDAALAGAIPSTPPQVAAEDANRLLADVATIAATFPDARRNAAVARGCLAGLAVKRGQVPAANPLGQAIRRLAKAIAPQAAWYWRLRVAFW